MASCRNVLWHHVEMYCGIMQKCTVASCRNVLWHHAEMYCGIVQKCTVASCRNVLWHRTEMYCGIVQKCTVASYRNVLWHHAEMYCGIMQKCIWFFTKNLFFLKEYNALSCIVVQAVRWLNLWACVTCGQIAPVAYPGIFFGGGGFNKFS